MAHGVTSSFGLEKLNRRIRTNLLRVERLAGSWIERGAMIDEQDTKGICVLVCSHIEPVEIQSPIPFDTREVLGCNPFDT